MTLKPEDIFANLPGECRKVDAPVPGARAKVEISKQISKQI